MVEMPSAAVTADLLALEADFFSIGTNDLTQYALAIDRVNQQVNYLFRPWHPAILRLIRFVVEAADRHGLPVSVCGEMAGDPLMTLVLVGLGVRVLSMNALAVPTIKRLVRGATARAARKLARQVLSLDTPQAVEQELLTAMESMFPMQSFVPNTEWDEDTIA
jgi:phosphotransferase system enzyme I (PtsI)